MIRLTKLNGLEFVLNCDLIETVEETPDTVISLLNGRKYVVKESIDEILEKMIQYKRKIYL
ncbi:MAG TPA: flagellar FlbD family protein [Clostridiaceae bacterium]|nr:flagellar FlbD family protein [Clostridiaceae bacterium]